jgi:triphosphoribosyl-dephospho-CoA synthase
MSLLYEVSASPKPGLVDRYNQGAHKDMDIFTFMASSAALPYYFYKCARQGASFKGGDLEELFGSLRCIGLEAEKAMFKATNGVNTHKGLIFSLGVICAAAAYCMKAKGNEYVKAEQICETVTRMTRGLCLRELISIRKSGGLTHGERVFEQYGIKGIRGEVEDGFPTVRLFSLPALKRLKAMTEYSFNDILVQILLILMAKSDDSNIAARHGAKMVEYTQEYARRIIDCGGMLSSQSRRMVYEMDREFIEKNISPGGSADLLAVTIMFDLLDEMK